MSENRLGIRPIGESDYRQGLEQVVLPYEMDAFGAAYDPFVSRGLSAEPEDLLTEEIRTPDEALQMLRLRQLNSIRRLSTEPYAFETIVEIHEVVATKAQFRVTYRPLESASVSGKPRSTVLSPAGDIIEDKLTYRYERIIIPFHIATVVQRKVGYFMDLWQPLEPGPENSESAERPPVMAGVL